MFSRLDTIPECDGRMNYRPIADVQIPHDGKDRAMQIVAQVKKKLKA